MNTSVLSSQELELFEKVEATKGTMEELERHLQESGVFVQYQLIYRQYCDIVHHATDSDERVEALKRVTFLNWYSQVEPSCYTGISGLDESLIRHSFNQLNTLIRNRQFDQEFTWMLSFYCSWDYVLLPYIDESLVEIRRFVETVDNNRLHVPERRLAKGTMDKRGQMGLYWKSMRVEKE